MGKVFIPWELATFTNQRVVLFFLGSVVKHLPAYQHTTRKVNRIVGWENKNKNILSKESCVNEEEGCVEAMVLVGVAAVVIVIVEAVVVMVAVVKSIFIKC